MLQEIAEDGHCASPWETLVKEASKLLEISDDILDQAIHIEIAEENLVQEEIDGKACLFLTPMYRAEVGAATSILRLLNGVPPWGIIDIDKAIPWVENKTVLTLSESQRNALKLALASKVVVITGGPGVGKLV